MNAPKVNKRILALDILRGFTIAGMILVNNPGSSFIISPPNEYSGLISFRIDWLDLFAVQGTLKSPYS